jgi:arsenate reductase-like glutaredoxin family protein
MKQMGVIARDKNQLTLIYSSNTRVGTHTLSYLTGIDEKLLPIDIAKTKVTGTQWAEIADMLGCKIGDLVDKRVVKVEDTSGFTSEDWIKILQNDNEVLTQPIAINGDKIKQIANPPEVLNFFGVESAGIEKTMHTDKPNIDNTTNGENFIEPK